MQVRFGSGGDANTDPWLRISASYFYFAEKRIPADALHQTREVPHVSIPCNTRPLSVASVI